MMLLLTLLLAISCVALTPDGVRSALIAGGVRVTATMFTCEPTYLFGDGNFGCANNNVYYFALLSSAATSFSLPAIDCKGRGAADGPSIFTQPPIFIRNNKALKSLTIGDVKDCPEIFIGGNTALESLTFAGQISNVTEITIEFNNALKGTLTLKVDSTSPKSSIYSFTANGNRTAAARFSVDLQSSSPLSILGFAANSGLESVTSSVPSLTNSLQLTYNPEVTSISLPLLVKSGDVRIYNNDKLSSIDLPMLANTTGLFQISNQIALNSLSLPQLASAGSVELRNQTSMSIALPRLALADLLTISNCKRLVELKLDALEASTKSSGSLITISNNDALPILSFPATLRIISALRVDNNSALTSVTFGDSKNMSLSNVNLSGNKALSNIVWPTSAEIAIFDISRCAFVGVIPPLPNVTLSCTLQLSGTRETNCFDCETMQPNVKQCSCIQCSKFTTVSGQTTSKKTTTMMNGNNMQTSTTKALIDSKSTVEQKSTNVGDTISANKSGDTNTDNGSTVTTTVNSAVSASFAGRSNVSLLLSCIVIVSVLVPLF